MKTHNEMLPNGRLIAFISCCGVPEAWVVRPDGTGLREVTTPAHRVVSLAPVWYPNSRKLLVSRLRRNGQTSLWTANVDGSGLSKVTDTASLVFYAWGHRTRQL